MNILVTENYNRKDIFEIVSSWLYSLANRQTKFSVYRLRASRKANRRTLSY